MTTTNCQVRVDDILEVEADVLVCSANVYLTMSGGVGGAFAQRFGTAMQENLFQFLAERGLRHVNQGDIVEMPACGSTYRAVLHAVAVDGTYDTTPAVVTDLVVACLRRASELAAQSVALTALATGYGRQSIAFFGQALAPVMVMDFAPVNRVIVGVRSTSDADELRSVLGSFR
ncbi:MAG TPA: macro domain-containing protein [Lacipirellulaceae bacterium]|jgi:O-acetyl-ADP-ribose deacetylase (regulator of RNase III)|nr:macro domain-containing protein [Lacipirellulaceae bacterium]